MNPKYIMVVLGVLILAGAGCADVSRQELQMEVNNNLNSEESVQSEVLGTTTTPQQVTEQIATEQTESNRGVCIVRNAITSAPNFSAPDIGVGYVKLNKPGIYSYDAVSAACTKEEYNALLKTYCLTNKEPVQFAVLTFNESGQPYSSGCGQFGCGSVSCP